MRCLVVLLALSSVAFAQRGGGGGGGAGGGGRRQLYVPDPTNRQHVRECQNRIIHQRGDSNYFYSWRHPRTRDEKVDWLDARNICRRHCMDLVSLETPQENNLIRNVIETDRIPYIWTSGRKCDFGGCDRADLKPTIVNGWFWSGSGAKIFPSNRRFAGTWSHTGGARRPQPDNREPTDGSGFGEQESCIAILNNFYNDGVVWHDVGCSHKKHFVCEDSKELINFVQSRARVQL
ncbi:unnamed protein product [Cyprideis torosa]|uniref:Uncharacterized protein n=1 Tax=Cyprideis torosa TaxID=163714 RepID=A0A7R8WHR8_9CRUS|nr:unnamed protein product [Cyprideis torosa]CAG0893583.1 unnamed protein product [Cyprideis torosa]